ncbi:LCP family protein [Staphylospora marina]|uniref:LCP family protein n=1 Tax=Staphylospora marina TaxID=2490858 RepID=UPI000F5BAF33|nr:LCP family protein [Staphylospora marina]
MIERVDQSRIDRVRKKRKKKWTIRVVSMVLVTLLGIGLYFGAQIWGAFADSKTELSKSKLRGEQEVKIKEDPFTVLFIGTDQRKANSDDWRSDVLMVVAVNPKTNSAKVISIPRDSYVKIACTKRTKDKITHSSIWGHRTGYGPVECIRETVENFLHIPIDYYARINFKGFEDIVDALGGVDVVVEKEFKQAMIGGKIAHFTPGPQHLSGPEALAYVRCRKGNACGNDFGRNQRQREVVSQLIDKIVSLDGVTKFGEITKALGKNFEYSFDLTEMPSLMAVYKNIPKQNIETLQGEYYDMKVGSSLVIGWRQESLEQVRAALQQQLQFTPKQPLPADDHGQPGQETGESLDDGSGGIEDGE